MTREIWPALGLGVGWRTEIALLIDRRRDLGFVEILAEDHFESDAALDCLDQLRERGVRIIPHGVSLSLGGAERPDRARLARLAALAQRVAAPLVSEHIAFVRAGGNEAGHLLPVPRTRAALAIVVANVREAQAALPVPLALENIASLVQWPNQELEEADFLAEVIELTGAGLLLDVENVYANSCNHECDAQLIERLPLDKVAYVHVGGGVAHGGVYHDTHAHAVPAAVLELLCDVCRRWPVPGAMLERDDGFPPDAEIHAELDQIAAALGERSAQSREDESELPSLVREGGSLTRLK